MRQNIRCKHFMWFIFAQHSYMTCTGFEGFFSFCAWLGNLYETLVMTLLFPFVTKTSFSQVISQLDRQHATTHRLTVGQSAINHYINMQTHSLQPEFMSQTNIFQQNQMSVLFLEIQTFTTVGKHIL